MSRGPRFWDRILNQEQKNMAYINGFENSVKTSLLYLENEIIYFWIWRRKLRTKIETKINGNNSLYCVLFDSHCLRSDVIPYGFLCKCEQICNLLRIWSYLLKEARGGYFVSCAAPDIIPGDALVLVAKGAIEHWSKLLLFRCFHFWLR